MKTTTTLGFIFLSLMATAQSKWATFNELLSKHEQYAIEKHINVWEAESPKDGDLYMAKFIYFRNKGVGQDEYNPKAEGFRVVDEEALQMAIKVCERARNDNPSRIDFHTERIELLIALKRLDVANTYLFKWIDETSYIPKPWLQSENKPVQEPEFLFKKVSQFADAWINNSDLSFGENFQGPSVGLDIAHAYIKSNPNDINGLYLLGKVMFKLDNLSEAEMVMMKFLKNKPKHIDGLFLMAEINEKNNLLDKAILNYKDIKKWGIKPLRKKAKLQIKSLKKQIKSQS